MGKRLRILAGPNGSGKSSVYEALAQNESFHWGVFVNADEIEKQLREQQYLDLGVYRVKNIPWDTFLVEYTVFFEEKGAKCAASFLRYIENKIFVLDSDRIDSYLASFIADYIRRALIEYKTDLTFTVETVMSHRSKLDFIRTAKEKGFKIYLYYVSTSSPDINVGRVQTRVQRGGHDVPEDKIRTRYERSLANLREAILLSDRAYLFDNSAMSYKWIAEYDGATGELRYIEEEIPQWVEDYL